MKVKKRTWSKPRTIYPAIYGDIREHGNSGRFNPSIPSEYVGKKAVLVILEEDEAIEDIKKEGINNGYCR